MFRIVAADLPVDAVVIARGATTFIVVNSALLPEQTAKLLTCTLGALLRDEAEEGVA